MTQSESGRTLSEAPRTDLPTAARSLRIALIGNPNTGKSTLFNALTGMRQRVGNYAGVTVERIEGRYRSESGTEVSVLDLPGAYSLSATSPDEEIALEVLLGLAPSVPVPDVVVLVVDASNLERNLFMASQVMELGLPVVIALNQVDAAEVSGLRIDAVELALTLGAQVVATVATRGTGLDVLRRAVERAPELPLPKRQFALPELVEKALAPVEQLLLQSGISPAATGMEALRMLSVNPSGHLSGIEGLSEAVTRAREEVQAGGMHARAVEAELRYGWISEVINSTVHRFGAGGRTLTDRIDAVVLHRVFGPLIFVVLMALVFQSVFTWAEPLMRVVERLVGVLADLAAGALPEGQLQSLLVDGVIAGVGSVIVFVPQIVILFTFIGILEATGYMARAAFIMDRFMRGVGLHGRSFIPMLSGYACAVPGIMATRTIDNPKDRLATIMVVPLMSCSARIPVYTLLIGSFIPATAVAGIFNLQGLTLLAMYFLGTAAALVIAGIFKKTLLRGPSHPMIMELPPYRLPDLQSLFLVVTQRAGLFLRRAGTVIFALTIVLWALATYPRVETSDLSPELAQEAQLAGSYLGRAGHLVEPVVAPLGFDWKIGVSIISSFAAREVFVATMGTIYGVGSGADETSSALRDRLINETRLDGTPAYTPLIAIALMVFYVFAMMCVSTNAIVARETGGGWTGARWAIFQFVWMFILAYSAALLVYRTGLLLGFAG
ncbi:MAG: ferrous iron transport protein B [Gemmatimonadota bacterium]|jgi:ferrous iron transport protein B|nr:ferrous iron transport protein B [Gemmatimonadota bacterium]